MVKKIFYILFFSLNIYNNISGQGCPVHKGKLFVDGVNLVDICFESSPPINTDMELPYTTKYTIKQNGLDIYTVSFDWYANKDSILIFFLNEKSKENFTRSFKYKKSYSLNIVNDKGFNDLTINKNGTYSILFTISDINSHSIKLNQFSSPKENPNLFFSLEPINDLDLDKQQNDARNYVQDSMIVADLAAKDLARKTAHQNEINALIDSMKAFRDAEIQKVLDKEKLIKKSVPNLNAIPEDQEKFVQILNPIINAKKNIMPYENYDDVIGLEFHTDGEGKIHQSKILTNCINIKLKEWFIDSVVPKIADEIETLTFNEQKSKCGSSNFNSKLNAKFNDIKYLILSKSKDFKTYDEDRLLIDFETSKIIISFDDYLDRETGAPTKYYYKIKYKSVHFFKRLICKKSDEGLQKLDKEKPIKGLSEKYLNEYPIINDIIYNKQFYDNIMVPEKDEYFVELCMVSINKDLAVDKEDAIGRGIKETTLEYINNLEK